MSTKKTRLISGGVLFWALVLSVTPAFAQEEQATKPTILSSEVPTLRFEHLGVANGLAQSSGNTIMQDSRGFLWIATQGGLHRYDGYNFKNYTSVPFDTTSLSESWVWAAEEAKNGDIWVTTENGGLNRLDRTTGTFTHYLHDADDSTSLSSNRTFFAFEGSNGDLWVSTFDNGLNRMLAGNDGHFSHYHHDPDDSTSLSSDVLFWINEDAKGKVWVGSANGLNRIDPATGEITRFLDEPKAPQGYGSPQNVLNMYFPAEDSDIIWLATGNGLVRLNSITGDHKRYLIAPNDTRQNPLNFLHQVVPDPDDPSVLWVGGPGTGIARFDMRTERFTAYRHNPGDPYSLSENYVQSLFTDRSGTIWVGTATEGLNAFNPGAVNFTHLRNNPDSKESLAPGIVWGVYEDQNGSLWVGTDVGAGGNHLTEFNNADGTIRRYRHDPGNASTLQPGIIRAFAEDANKHFWVAGGGGLSRLDRSTGDVSRFAHDNTPANRGRNIIFALFASSADANTLWIGSVGGLDTFDTRTGQYTPVLLDSSIADNDFAVLCLYENADRNEIWAGTSIGLMRVDSSGTAAIMSSHNSKDTTTISQNAIFSIAVSQKEPDILWLATQNGGLDRFDINTGVASHYTMEQGLPSNTIYAILNDSNGTLWMSTNNGISNFDPETEIFRNYGLDDGLMGLEYNQNAYARGAGGVLYFGSGKGVTAFAPEQLHINNIPPQVVLSGFKLFNKPVAVGPESPLTKPIDETEKITLKFNQNEVTFDFVALHFVNAAQNKYAYQLVGFDEDWVDAGTHRSANYTNLPPGDYTFQVKAANADGIWNEEGASVQLAVLPPWWRTWWAYGLFALIMGSMVFGVDRVQRRRLLKKEHERTALREAELRAEAENRRRADTEQLSQIGRAITSSLSIHIIIDTVYENVNALMDAAIFGVGIYNDERYCLEFPATKEEGKMLPPYINRLDEENRLGVLCFKNKEEIIIGDFPEEYSQYIKVYKPPIQGKDATSILYLPLMHQERMIGVITTQSFKKNAYTEYHINLLRNLATYAAIALDNAAAYRQLNTTLSELKTMQQQLIQQEKLASLGQLTAGIAHEIKNPLNFVNNFSDVSIELIEELQEELKQQKADVKREKSRLEGGAGAQAEVGDVREQAKSSDINYVLSILDDIEANLRKIHEHGSRADGIVRSMLQHSRGGSGKKEPANLNVLIREYVNLAFHGMRAGKNPINIDIVLDLDEDIGTVPMVGEDFSRVILNLCNNAFDAMRQKLDGSGQTPDMYLPKLTVRTRRKDANILIEIEDNGPGIPEGIKSKIFQPFFTTKKGTEGTGLGLSITNDIAKAHGGDLKVATKKGEGSRFSIELPLT